MSGAPTLDAAERYQVTEGIHGYYAYHLSHQGQHAKSLCGERTMSTSLPLKMFGVGKPAPEGSGLNGRWCEECKRLAALGS